MRSVVCTCACDEVKSKEVFVSLFEHATCRTVCPTRVFRMLVV